MANQNRRTRWSVLIFAVLMSVILVGSLATGWLMQIAQQRDLRRQQQEALQPTAIPTFAPPIAVEGITFDEEALQANGVFSISVPNPPEWGAVESSFDGFANRARLLLRNDRNVVEATAEEPQQPIASIDDLDTFYNAQTLGTSWRNYTGWRETDRQRIADDTALQIDFELEFGNRNYVARQRSWMDDEQVYSVRVITPENATELLVYLLDNVADSFETVETLNTVPVSWSAYYDPTAGHIIRYPNGWQITDAADGAPASIETNNVSLRVETLAGTSIENAAAAEEYAAALPDAIEVLTVTEVQQGGLDGYSVSYRTRNLDGETGSGLVTLLNGGEVLHAANLRVNALDVDLNTVDVGEAAVDEAGPAPAAPNATTPEAEYLAILGTFQPLSGYRYAELAAASAAPLTDAGQGQPNIGF